MEKFDLKQITENKPLLYTIIICGGLAVVMFISMIGVVAHVNSSNAGAKSQDGQIKAAQKVIKNDPITLFTTENAGKGLGMNIGKIEEGALADLLIIDTDNYSFLSPGSFLANLIYSAHSDCVDSVICKGRFVMRNRVVPGEKEILKEARRILKKLEL